MPTAELTVTAITTKAHKELLQSFRDLADGLVTHTRDTTRRRAALDFIEEFDARLAEAPPDEHADG